MVTVQTEGEEKVTMTPKKYLKSYRPMPKVEVVSLVFEADGRQC